MESTVELARRFEALGRFGRLTAGHVPDLAPPGIPDALARYRADAAKAAHQPKAGAEPETTADAPAAAAPADAPAADAATEGSE